MGSKISKSKKKWKSLDPELSQLGKRLLSAQIWHGDTPPPFRIEVYHCQPVMDLAGFFREKTKAAEWGSQHHALKICFGRSHYGNQAIFEKMVNATRVDILLLEDMKIIEVKTLSNVSPDQHVFSKLSPDRRLESISAKISGSRLQMDIFFII